MKDEKRTPRKPPLQQADKANGNGRAAPVVTTAPRKNGPFVAEGADLIPDDENRIDWERKQKGRRSKEDDEPEEAETNDADANLSEPILHVANGKKKSKQDARKKRRQLVYDEQSGRVVMKRKRKRSRPVDLHQMIDLDEDVWDEFEQD